MCLVTHWSCVRPPPRLGGIVMVSVEQTSMITEAILSVPRSPRRSWSTPSHLATICQLHVLSLGFQDWFQGTGGVFVLEDGERP